MDVMVLETQQWLNKTYGKDSRFVKVEESGSTGWPTIYGLTRALQIELGIKNTANNFGPSTQQLFSKKWPSGVKEQKSDDKSESNVYAIIQGALWCKGYSTGSHITKHFYSGTGKGIKKLKSDMGIGGDSTVTLEIMKALLSMQQYVLLSRYGGKPAFRNIQQNINRNYVNYTGIIPTDGVYGREMNKAMIKVLQSIEGYTPSEATGNLGDGTKGRLKTVSAQNFNRKWLWLAHVMLICNGFNIDVSDRWSEELGNSIKSFQIKYSLPQTGVIDKTTWLSLFISKGDTDRSAIACDTRFEITDELAKNLKKDGYKIVGRYLTGGSFKEIREGELERIIDNGLKYFPIFQDKGRSLSDFSYESGKANGKAASESALQKGVPPTVIYFAVDFDVYDSQIDSNIIPYFKGVNETINADYQVGIYSSRNVCSRVAKTGYAVSSFVSDMSTGYSGNLGFTIPDNWNYDQFYEIRGYGGKWDLDKVAYSGKVDACSSTLNDDKDKKLFIDWIKETEKSCLEKFNNVLSPWYGYSYVIGRAILEFLRKPEYWSNNYGGLWPKYTPEISLDEKETSARGICQTLCGEQPNIKDKMNELDIAHMAATALGYIHWGIPENKDDYSLGDLGGWPLDLLQIWGYYLNEANGQNLEDWICKHLGSNIDGMGFGYNDVLADADAYLLITHMKNRTTETRFSETISEIFSLSRNERIKLFYNERFNSASSSVENSFIKLIDGIDIGDIKNIIGGKKALIKASKANRLPSKEEARKLADAYSKFIN